MRCLLICFLLGCCAVPLFALPAEGEAVPASDAAIGVVGADRAQIDGFKAEAMGVIRRLEDDFPENPHALGLSGNLYFLLGNQDAAFAAWQEATRLSPDTALGYYAMAQVAFSKEDHEDAARLLRRTLELDPRYPNARCMLGETLLLMGAFEDAEAAFRGASEEDATGYRPVFFLAQIAFQRRDYASAARLFQEALSRKPDYSEAWYGLARAQLLSGDREAARSSMDSFNRLKSSERDWDMTQRSAHDDLSRLREELAGVMSDIGGIYLRAGNRDESERLWRRVCELAPEAIVPLLNLGNMKLKERKWQEAEHYFGLVCSRFPDHAIAFKMRLQALMNMDVGGEELLECAERAAALDSSAEVLFLLGQVRFRTGDRRGAVEILEEASEKYPNHRNIKEALRRIKVTIDGR